MGRPRDARRRNRRVVIGVPRLNHLFVGLLQAVGWKRSSASVIDEYIVGRDVHQAAEDASLEKSTSSP